MKHKTILITLITVLLTVILVSADIPQVINYQGNLTESDGTPSDGAYPIRFIIYDSATGGNELWNSNIQMITVTNGLFEVMLGTDPMPPLPDNLFSVDTTRYLGITISADPEISPRIRFTSLAYAYQSLRADSAGYATIANSVVDGSITNADINNSAAIDATKINGTAATLSATQTFDGAINAFNNKVGIGTTSPNVETKLHVASGSIYSGYFTSNRLISSTHIIHAEYAGNLGQHDVKAVYGYSVPYDNYGYGGYFQGGYKGVYGVVAPSGSSIYYGVYGHCTGGSGNNYGVYGYAYGSGTNYGVYGRTGGTGTGYAGYFEGDITVTGNINKSGASFQIDHPLDPANKYLYHSSVESPEMKNVYDGNVVLDANGEVTVVLPDYFEALNKEFRYQLTCIDGFAPVYIAEKISNNSFKIAGGDPGMEVSWQVTGIRKDKWAKANQNQVEVDKPAKEKGLYLHPEVYGLGEKMSINYEQNKESERNMVESEKN